MATEKEFDHVLVLNIDGDYDSTKTLIKILKGKRDGEYDSFSKECYY